jgi:cobalt-zinc-cadmium efflux system outer membrane protein
MSWSQRRQLVLPLMSCLLAACASVPRDAGRAQVAELVATRGAPAPHTAETVPAIEALLAAPLTRAAAIRLALLNNPRLQVEYARLGIARGELLDAARIANPTFSFAELDVRGGDGRRLTRGLTLGFAEVLLLPSRKRLAAAEFERVQRAVAAALLDLAIDTEAAWYTALGAEQVAAMRAAVARAAAVSAAAAERFRDAGNLSALELAVERAAASQAALESTRAAAQARRARVALAALLGVPAAGEWTLPSLLPAPIETLPEREPLLALAVDARLDLDALRREVALREDALATTRRFRWLGEIELGYESERESDGERLRGPTLAVELPIFDQHQGAIARAEAELDDARGRLRGLELAVRNEAALAYDGLQAASAIALEYRDALVPQREAIVARTQEEVNFMLKGVFELLLVKQQEYDAYQGYLEAVRDYWIARAELRRAIGGALPDDDSEPEPTLGVDTILRGATPPAMHEHGAHRGHSGTPQPQTGREPEHERGAEPEPHREHEPAHGHEHEHEHGDTP